MPTIGEEVLRRYYALKKKAHERIGRFPLPDGVDQADIVSLILTHFRDAKDGDYLPVLQKFGAAFGGTPDQISLMYDDVKTFIDWVLHVLRAHSTSH